MKSAVKTVYFLISTVILLTACGSSPKQKASSDQPVYDTKSPATYQAYQKWRAENDPAAERYAEYKRWEIQFRRWQAEQEKR